MAIRIRMVSAMLLLVFLAAIVAPAAAPRRSDAFIDLLMTIGAVLGIGKVTEGLVNDTIDKADGAAKDVMREAAAQIDKLLQQIQTTYGNALNTTLDSLDSFTGQQLAKLATLFDQINQQLMDDVDVIQQAVVDLLQQVNQMIQQTLKGLEDLIVVGVRGATFVIDKTTYNVAFLIAVVLLAIGLLIFTRLLWTGVVPKGWVRVVALGFMAFYVLLFTGLLIPQTRVYAITMVGQADKLKEIGPGARIFSVTPNKVVKGATSDLMLVGANFGPNGSSAPKVVIAGQEVAPKAWSDSQIAVQLTGSLANLDGQQSIAVKTADGKLSTPSIVQFVAAPPPPQITSWRLLPSGRAWDFRQTAAVTVTCSSASMFPVLFDRQISVDSGWELAADPQHLASYNGSLQGSAPSPAYGFSESNLTQTGNGVINRSIQYLPSADAVTKTGIRVGGSCMGLFGSSYGFSARYSLWEKKLLPKDGTPVSGGPCLARGTSKCATYPADKLSMFKDGRPESYTLMVTIRTPSGQTVDKSAVFTPGTPGQKITVESVSVWMENNDLWVKGPGTNRPPLGIILQPLKPVPFKPLPIFHK